MASTAACFGFNVMCIFSLYDVLTMENLTELHIVFSLVIDIMWNVYYFSFFLLIIFVGSAVSKEVNIQCINRSVMIVEIFILFRVG